ncbi:fts3-like protein [Halocaridina rubra]|uniref:Ferritin n=1 Tax=Halocaridina rubra TaxID=373956 RepID=A0AAN9A2J0_HALRR
MVSVIRHNFHEDCEAALNKHINLEMHLSYVFLSMSHHFDRDDISLPGFSKFFRKAGEVTKSHADKMMEYQNKRGGRIVLQSINAPSAQDWGTPTDSIDTALSLKKKIHQSLREMQQGASNKCDSHMCHFLEDNFLEEHIDTIKKLGDIKTQLKRVGTGPGLYMFDKEFM